MDIHPEPFFGDTRLRTDERDSLPGQILPTILCTPLYLCHSSRQACVRSGKSHDNITRIPNFARSSSPRPPSFGFDPKIVIATFGKVVIRRIDELRENQSQFHRDEKSSARNKGNNSIGSLAFKRLVFHLFNV